jgi:hypothetical protein
VEWSGNRQLEWCPPGHGDLYSALYGSGKLDALLAEGVKYMFVSNSDNLGATLDLDLLTYFAQSGMPFMMECCRRTEADKKGGHLALRSVRDSLSLSLSLIDLTLLLDRLTNNSFSASQLNVPKRTKTPSRRSSFTNISTRTTSGSVLTF